MHSGDHFDDIHRQNKEKILNENRDVFFFIYTMWKVPWMKKNNMNELVMVLNGIRNTDQLRYVMF